MNADTEDFLQRPKSDGTAWRIAAIAVVVTVAGGYWIYNAEMESQLKLSKEAEAKQIALMQEQEKQPAHAPAHMPQPVARKTTTANTNARHSPSTWDDEPIILTPAPAPQVKQSDLNAEGRQVVFNDKNYRPTNKVNTVAAVTPKQNRKAQTRSKNQQVRKQAPWSWETYKNGTGGARKVVNRGTFSYTVKNGMVMTNTVCSNETPGSFMYRECRKGAKEYFKRMCSNSNQEACTGADMMP